jgi:hypothetical protein
VERRRLLARLSVEELAEAMSDWLKAHPSSTLVSESLPQLLAVEGAEMTSARVVDIPERRLTDAGEGPNDEFVVWADIEVEFNAPAFDDDVDLSRTNETVVEDVQLLVRADLEEAGGGTVSITIDDLSHDFVARARLG